MTDICIDTEFIEDGKTIDLISIALVTDEREYYAVASDAPWGRVKKSDWLVRNVVPSLPVTGRRLLETYLAHSPSSYPQPSIDMLGIDVTDSRVKPRQVIANEVRDFIVATPDPQLWAWYAAYDHVVLCQLWGTMMQLPDGCPMWTNDLKQEVVRLGNPQLPAMPGVNEHDALSDARETLYRLRWLRSQDAPA
jgi:hypothetical protein